MQCANGANYIEFPYDWRIDLLRSAALLGDLLNTLVEKDRATRITLVCHSMGGAGRSDTLKSTGSGFPPKWKGNVKKLLSRICVPHILVRRNLGAMCMGLQGETTITARDVKTLCDSTDYPTAYQLLPPESKVFVWSFDDPRQQKPPRGHLPERNGAAAYSHHSKSCVSSTSFAHHNPDKRPKNVEYTFVYGTNHRTEEKFYVKGSTVTLWTDDLGDGTVPIWSAGQYGYSTRHKHVVHPWRSYWHSDRAGIQGLPAGLLRHGCRIPPSQVACRQCRGAVARQAHLCSRRGNSSPDHSGQGSDQDKFYCAPGAVRLEAGGPCPDRGSQAGKISGRSGQVHPRRFLLRLDRVVIV